VSNDWYGSPVRDYTVMAYLKAPEDTVWITNSAGYTNMMHMDGSKPTGFIDSEYSTGVVHNAPNDPLRCFYYQHENLSFKSCTEYGYEYIEYDDGEDEDCDGDNCDDGDHYDDWDSYDYQVCGGLEYEPEQYVYTCFYDMWGNLETCSCELKITCLRDIWVYSTNKEEFFDLLFKNMWTVFVWFNFSDVVYFLSKSFES
jgi:hypothetical protein